MKNMPRRDFVQAALALPLAAGIPAAVHAGESVSRGVCVGKDIDRRGTRRKVFGLLPIDVKVSGADTGGGLFVLEQVDDRQGGPPRHVHHDQDEWFHVVEGTYVVEVGEDRFVLAEGDSVLAPRGVPHVWAHTGPEIGRLLIAFQPAGAMESYFDEATRLEGIPAREELARLFEAHGMTVLGPPLPVD